MYNENEILASNDNDPFPDAMPIDEGIFTDEQFDNIYDNVSDDFLENADGLSSDILPDVLSVETDTSIGYMLIHSDMEILHNDMLKLNNFVSLIFAFVFLYFIYRIFKACWHFLYDWFFRDI